MSALRPARERGIVPPPPHMMRLPSLAIFRHRAFLHFWIGRLLATLGTQIQLTAIGWQIYDAARAHGQSVSEAALLLGLTGLAQFIPLVSLSLIGGSAADRYDRKRLLLLCYGGKALIAAALVFCAGLDAALLIPIVFTVSVAAGAINAFLPAASTSLAPMLVPRAELPTAIAWSSLGFQLGAIAGPALGGVLYGFGATTPYAATLVFYAIALALMMGVATPRQQPIEDTRASAMILDGLRYVRDNKIVLGALSLDLIVVLLAGAVALLPVFARDILHAGPSELGLLRAAMGAGAALTALVLAAAPIRTNVGKWMFGATFLFGIATIAFGLSQTLWLTIAALAVAGGADMVSVYIRSSLVQLNTPDAMRGRVSAVNYVFISASNELGDFEAGLMARIFGPVLAVTIGGVGAIAASAWWIALFPALAKADGLEPALDPEPSATPRTAS